MFDHGIKASEHQSECAGVHGNTIYILEGQIEGLCHFFFKELNDFTSYQTMCTKIQKFGGFLADILELGARNSLVLTVFVATSLWGYIAHT